MSFVWKRPEGRLKSPEQCAREILEVSRARGLNDFAAVLAVMCVAQESDFWCPWNRKDAASKKYPFDSESDDGRSVGYFQQQNGKPGEVVSGSDNWWGPMSQRMDLKKSCNEFLSRLEDNYMEAVNDRGMASRRFIQNVQRSAYPDAYAKHWDRAQQLVRAAAEGQPAPEPTNGGTDVGVSGDPIWLEDVWREALGDRLIVHEGWQERGVGGVMGEIWGTMIHHTGNDNETVENIRDGVDQGPPNGFLQGPLSQALITRDGKLHLIAVGPCNHAGGGFWKDLTDGNRQAIGIECAYDGNPQRWPDAMIITMRDAAAAVSKKLGKRAQDSVCGHKEYAKPQGRKPDPANVDMDWFRDEVQKDLDGFVFPGEAVTTPQPPVVVPPSDEEIMYYANVAYWEMLGWRTPTEALAVILDAVTGERNAGKPGVSLVRPNRPE